MARFKHSPLTGIFVTAGLSNGAIAERLHFSVSAVEKNINAIFAKLDLSGPGGPGVHQT
jgi:hypothetical protein